MNVFKANLLVVTLLSFSAGTVGQATAQQVTTASFNTTQALFDADQTATESTSADENINASTVNTSADPTMRNQTANSQTAKLTLASSYKTIQPTSNTFATAPLRVLGPSDDLSSIVGHASGVVLIDFYADWCGPCRKQGGILHQMEHTASQNGASIIKINIDQHRELASEFNVTSLPTLILVKQGQIIERQTGLANHQRIASLLSR